jgi:hypothetical protein
MIYTTKIKTRNIFNWPSQCLNGVGDLDPVKVANQNIFKVATEDGSRPNKKYPITNQTHLRPKFNDRYFFLGCEQILNFWVASGSGRDLRVDGSQHYVWTKIKNMHSISRDISILSISPKSILILNLK